MLNPGVNRFFFGGHHPRHWQNVIGQQLNPGVVGAPTLSAILQAANELAGVARSTREIVTTIQQMFPSAAIRDAVRAARSMMPHYDLSFLLKYPTLKDFPDDPRPPGRSGGGPPGPVSARVLSRNDINFRNGTAGSMSEDVVYGPSLPRIGSPFRVRLPSSPLTSCGKKYLSVLDDPFAAVEGACFPTNDLALPTEKAKCVTRATGSTNASGTFVAVVRPVFASDNYGFWVSTGATTYVGTVEASRISGNANYNPTEFPYTSAELASATGDSVQGRIVGMGIRCQYIGPAQDRQGVFYGFEAPSHQDVDSYTWAQITNDDCTFSQPVTEKPVSVYWSGPKRDSDIAFHSYYTPVVYRGSTTPVWPSNGCLVVVGSGLPASTACVFVEVVWHVEYAGPGVKGATLDMPGPHDVSLPVQVMNKTVVANPGPNKLNALTGNKKAIRDQGMNLNVAQGPVGMASRPRKLKASRRSKRKSFRSKGRYGYRKRKYARR